MAIRYFQNPRGGLFYGEMTDEQAARWEAVANEITQAQYDAAKAAQQAEQGEQVP